MFASRPMSVPPGRRVSSRGVLIVLLAPLAAVAAAGTVDPCQPGRPVPHGGERLISELADAQNGLPSVAATPGGGVVAAWWRANSGNGQVVMRRLAADAAPLAGERELLESIEGRVMLNRNRPELRALAGDAVQIAWSGNFWEQTGASQWTWRDTIMTRRYDRDGDPLTDYVPVPIQHDGEQADPAIATTANDNTVVVWSGAGEGDTNGSFQRLFGAAGTPSEVVSLVNTVTVNGQFQPRVAGSAFRYAVVWRGNGPGDEQGVFVRMFDAAGIALSAETRVNETTSGTQLQPDVAMRPDGRSVVVWQGNGPGDDWGVFARRYAAGGAPLGGEIAVNTTTAGNQVNPSVATMPDGGFVVTWNGAGDGDDTGVFLRRFDAYGTPHGPELRVNTTAAGAQAQPAVAVARGGEIVVAWTGAGQGVDSGIFAQAYARPLNLHRSGFEPDDAACVP